MPRVYIHMEGFEFVEARGTVSPEEFAQKFGIQVTSARSWLSKYAGKGYLKFVSSSETNFVRKPGRPGGGKYGVGKKPWMELYYDETI